MELKKVDVKEIDQINREVSVELAAEDFNRSFDQKLAEAQKKADLKGFRKGKAPLNIIKQQFGEQIKGDVIDDLIKDSYAQVIRDNKLIVASYPTLTDAELKDDGVFRYTVKVEVFPKLEKVDYDGIEVGTVPVDATDEEVEQQTEALLKQHSELRIMERAAVATDTVVVDLKKLLDTKMILDHDEFPSSVIDLANQMTIQEFRDNIPGMNVGDSKEITVKYPDDYSDQKFAGAEIKYECKLKEVNERIMPTLDDAFAKKIGLGETALELKIKLREDITRYKGEQLRKEQKNMLIAQVCQKNEIPVPNASVEDYLQNVIEDFKKNGQEINEEEIRQNYRQIGENTFRWGMIMHKLAELENIKVSPEDTENLIKKFADNYKMTVEQAKQALQQSGRIANIRDSILEDKVLDFLFSKAKVVEPKK